MDSVELGAVAGVLLSIGVAYGPGFESWFEKRTPIEKRQIFAGLVLLASVAVVGISCTPVLVNLLPAGWVVQCTSLGVTEFVKVVLATFLSSQGTFVALPAKAKQLPAA